MSTEPNYDPEADTPQLIRRLRDTVGTTGMNSQEFCSDVSNACLALERLQRWEKEATQGVEMKSAYLILQGYYSDTTPVCVFLGKDEVEAFLAVAPNKDHAIKIANERRIRLLAENKWGENV